MNRELNSKKAGQLFLTLVIAHIIGSYIYQYIQNIFGNNVLFGLLYSQMLILIPALGFLIFNKIGLKEIGPFHKINITSMLMVILFTYLIMPLITTINIATLYFTENRALELSNSISEMPFLLNFTIIAIVAPLSEEIIFRGIIFRGYKKNNILLGAIFSGIIFGLMHLNVNQMSYAIVIGIILALLIEATGSIWAAVTAHFVINAQNVAAMYFAGNMLKNVDDTGSLLQEYGFDMGNAGFNITNLTPEYITIILITYGCISIFTTSLAIGVYIWLAKHNNRSDHLMRIYQKGLKNNGKNITISFIAALVLCIIIMVAYELFM